MSEPILENMCSQLEMRYTLIDMSLYTKCMISIEFHRKQKKKTTKLHASTRIGLFDTKIRNKKKEIEHAVETIRQRLCTLYTILNNLIIFNKKNLLIYFY